MKVALCLTGLVGSKSGKSWDKEGGTDEVLETCAKYFNKHNFSHTTKLYSGKFRIKFKHTTNNIRWNISFFQGL